MTLRASVLFPLLIAIGCGSGAILGGSTPADDDRDEPASDDDDPAPDEPGPGWGRLDATLVYDGARRFAGADVYLLAAEDGDDDPCAAIDPVAPGGAVTVVSLADALGDVARFDDLAPGSRVAVAAAALDDSGVVSAFGCHPPVAVPEDVLEVPVAIADRAASLEGTWEVESHLRLDEGIPLGTRLALGVLDEMTDDANDPATFLLDLLLAQFIEDEGLRTALGWVRQSAGIDRGLNDRIRDWAPDLLLDAAAAAGDLARALDDLRIDSRLEIGEPDADGVSLAQHELLDLVFELDDRDTRFSIARDVGLRDTTARDVVVGLDDTGRAELGRHSYALGLGTVALFALHEVILPRLDGSPRTLGEMLSMLVDCREVGDWLSAETGVGSDDDWEDACTMGLSGIGAYLELQLLALDEDLSTLSLEGHAEVGGDKVLPGELEDGEWEVTWSGTAGALPFGGDLEARRIGVASGRGAE